MVSGTAFEKRGKTRPVAMRYFLEKSFFYLTQMDLICPSAAVQFPSWVAFPSCWQHAAQDAASAIDFCSVILINKYTSTEM
jgi:hypothetical protein